MEDYDKFVQLCVSRLRKTEGENHRPSTVPSVIRFYGRPVLPPLLSGEQRKEMQRHRDAALLHRKTADPRMAYVQSILQSVQLGKTPTLEELLQESDTYATSSHSHDTSVTKDTLLPEGKEKDASSPPLTSTTRSAFITSNVTPQPSCLEQCLTNDHYSQWGSQPYILNGANHQSESAGYMTRENVENTTSVSEENNAGGASLVFGSSEGESNMGQSLHNASNTIAKMPDIISHPPVDGEELERSGQELSFCTDFIVAKDISCTLIQDVSMKCDHSPRERCKSGHVKSLEGEDDLSVNTLHNLDKDFNLDRTGSLMASSENSSFLDKPESPQILNAPRCPDRDQHTEPDPPETEPAGNDGDDAEPELHRSSSLQALLKKSQEYRRRQRLLRNQAKNTKFHETIQEQARSRTEEPSLSDKENDEFPNKGAVSAEERRSKQRRGTFVQTPPKWLNESVIEKRTNAENTHLTVDGTNVEVELALRNKQLNISQEIITEPKQIGAFPHQWGGFTGTSPEGVQVPYPGFHARVRKENTLLAPTFCGSLVDGKLKGSIQDVQVSNERGISEIKVCENMGVSKERKVEVIPDHRNGHKAVASIGNPTDEDVAKEASATSSQHIDQPDSNLSSLKVLMSDPAFPLTGNVGIRSQTGLSADSGFEGAKQMPSDSVYSESDMRERVDDGDEDEGQRCRVCQEKQSDDFQNVHEDGGPCPSVTDRVPLTGQFTGAEAVHFHQLREVKPLAKGNAACEEILTARSGRHDGRRKQQLPADRVRSASQRLHIPDDFRNIPSEKTAPHHTSAFYTSSLDTRKHQEERRPETTGGHHPTVWLSLNQSHDMDAPSGPRSLEGTGPDFSLGFHHVPEKHLTPKSEGEGQGGVSKVKRRLHMQEMEDKADAIRGRDAAVRTNCSTPRGAVWWQGGHGHQLDQREELKRVQADQIKALRDEHRRQEEELLKVLAARYRVLQSMSFPSSVPSSHLGDTVTFPTLSQLSIPMPDRCRLLLAAVVKGFLTRRLLKTERVAQLARTIKDTQQFLQTFQQQSPDRGASCSRQDLLLQERAAVQLRAARYEVSDIFFSLTAREKMQLICWDRELVRRRECKQQWSHRPTQRKKLFISCNTEVTGEEESNDDPENSK